MIDLIHKYDLIFMPLQTEPLFILLAVLLIDVCSGSQSCSRYKLFHPVFALCILIRWLEGRLNRDRRSPYTRLIRGGIVMLFVFFLSYATGYILVVVTNITPFGWLIALLIIGSLISLRRPFYEVKKLSKTIRDDGLRLVQDQFAWLPRFNISDDKQETILKAAIGYLGLQISEGLIAAIFWYLLLGIPGLFAWRGLNIMSEILDIRDPRNVDFGWAAATMSDAIAYLPSLFSVIFVFLGAIFVPKANPCNALSVALKYGSSNKQYCRGLPASAMAGAIGFIWLRTNSLEAEKQAYSDRNRNMLECWIWQTQSKEAIGYIDFVRSLYLYAVVCLLSFLAVLVLAMMQIAGS